MPSEKANRYRWPYIRCPIRLQRPLHPAVAVCVFGLALGLASLLLVTGRLPDSLLILFAIPVVVSPFLSYGRQVYLPMAALLAIAAVSVTSVLSSNFRASLLTILFSTSSMVAMAEIIYRLARSRQRAEAALRESEERYRLLFEHSPVGIVYYDAQLCITDCNERLAVILQSCRDWLVGLDIHTASDQSVVPCLQIAIEGQEGSYEDLYHTLSRPAGAWISVRAAPLIDHDGHIKGGIGIAEDITERKLAEQALQDAEWEKGVILDSLAELVVYHDLEHRVLWANQAACESAGMPRETLAGQHCYCIWTPLEQPCPDCPVEAAMRTGEPRSVEGIMPDGRQWFIRGYPVRDRQGSVIGGIEVAEDITDRKWTEERVVHLNTVLRAIRNVNQIITRERDPERLVQGACNTLVETRGYHNAWLVLIDDAGRPTAAAEAGLERWSPAEFVQQNQLPRCIEQSLSSSDLLTLRASSLSEPGQSKEGSDIGTLAIRLAHEGKVFGALSVSLPDHLAADQAEQELFKELAGDISFALYSIEQQKKRKQAEEALLCEAGINATMAELSRAFLISSSLDHISELVLADAMLLTNSPLGYAGYIDQVTGQLVCPTLTGRVWDLCQMEHKTFRFREFAGLWGWVLDHQQPLLTNQPVHDPRSTGTPAGHIPIDRFLSVPAVVDGKTVGQIALANAETDYDERDLAVIERLADVYAIAIQQKRLEEQLLQSQKMEAVGRLAGGIAHDFNNHLTAITGYSELILDELERNSLLREDVEEIRKAAERSMALTRQLLAFSRRQILEPRLLDLNQIVANMENMLQRLIGEHIRLQLELSPFPAQIRADLGQIEQVIMNLIVNARDALPDGGKITIQTASVSAGKIQGPHRLLVPVGNYATLSVIDDGVGMDKDTQSHLFEPFFTTKAEGKGTGLGLATAYGIIRQSGGYIFADSELGRGSTFAIYLPRAEEGLQPGQGSTADPTFSQGSETILLVEDEDAVRTLARRVLQRQGYIVLEACNAIEALDLCEQYTEPIHMLVTDVIMPGGINGRVLAEQLVCQRPETKVLYISGYTDDAIAHHGVLDPGVNLLQKPFTADTLARRVRDTFDGP
jgi:PAS domain S-box-containing protein